METKRLLLRTLISEDAQQLFHIFSDEATMFFTDTDPIKNVREATEEITFMDHLLQKGHGIRWGIFQKSDQRLLGTCGYHKWDKISHKAEIGYELGSSYWRQGYMTEVFPQLLAYGFEEMRLHRVEAPVIKENFKSVKLLEKFGFQAEGIRRESIFCKGRFRDECYFSLLKKEWLVVK